MLSLGKQMQVDLTHERSVLIRIARELLRSIPTLEAKAIIEIARRAGHGCAKKTVAMNSLRRDRLVCLSI